MRGVTLGAMVQKFRFETGQSMQLAQGVQTREHVKHLLNRVQEQLYNDFDWPFLRIYREENLLTGERLYSWPADLKVEDVRQFYDSWNNNWVPVQYGIEQEDYNALGPNDRSDPVLRWQIYDAEQYIVWPTPASARTAKIYGYKAYTTMQLDSDVCQLDDNMIVLFAAAEWLARQKMPDAQAKLSAAQRLRQRYQGKLVSDKRRNIIPLVGGVSPNAVYVSPARRDFGNPPPIPQ